MDRRGFLRGMFGGVAAGGLIIAAKPAEIEAFAAPLAKDAPLILDTPVMPTHQHLACGEHLYNARGEVVAIVTELRLDTVGIPAGDSFGYKRYIPGPSELSIRAVGIGTVEHQAAGPRLRGLKP